MRRLRELCGIVLTIGLVAGPALAQEQTPTSSDAANRGEGVFVPPPCTGTLFSDVTCTTPFDAWIEQFARDGVTAGCGGGAYCPNGTVTRAQMAVFIEKAMRGTASWPAHTIQVWAVPAAAAGIETLASGQALLAALASIPTTGPDAPTSNAPWLIKLGPGTFTIAPSTLYMKDWVDIEGSGRTSTFIRSCGTDNPVGVGPPSSAQLRDLGVEHAGGSVQSVAVYTNSGGISLRNVYLHAYGGAGTNAGLWADSGGPVIDDATIYTDGNGGNNAYGVYATNGTQVNVRNCYVSVSNASVVSAGVWAGASGGAIVTDAVINSVGVNKLRTDTNGYISASFSRLLHGTISGSNISCAAIVDGSNVFHASSCP